MADEELVWAAGFYDGEGNIHFDGNAVRLSVCQSSHDGHIPMELQRFADAVGEVGRITTWHSAAAKLPVWGWRTAKARDVVRVVEELWPHVSNTKRKQFLRVFEAALKTGWPNRRGLSHR